MDGALAVEPDRPGGGVVRWALALAFVAGAVWVLMTETAFGISEAVNVQQGGFESPGQWLIVAALVLLGLVGSAIAFLVLELTRFRLQSGNRRRGSVTSFTVTPTHRHTSDWGAAWPS